MNRRHLLRLAGLAGVAGLTGCGVASRGGVVVDGPGPSAGTGSTRSDSTLLSRAAASAIDQQVFINNFLSQASGDPANTGPALERWRNYMTDEFQREWESENRLTVVWLRFKLPQEGEPQSADRKFIYDMVPLGRLDKRGWLQPVSDAPREVTFTVTTKRNKNVPDDQIKPDQTFYIKNIENAPEGMLVSTDAMKARYEYRNLYFWDRSGRFLIPDGRYAPVEWEEPTKEKKLVEWLIAGPSSWLASAVQPPPDGISMLDQPSKIGPNKLALNFNFSNSAGDNFNGDKLLPKFVSQLTWTLLPECRALGGDREISPIVIKVDSVEKKTKEPVRYLPDNPTAVKVAGEQYQQAFAIDERRVRRVRNGAEVEDTPPPLLSDEQNHEVDWAAYGSDRKTGQVNRVALVTRDSRGRPALLVGTGPKLWPVAGLAGKKMTQPVFVDADSLFVIAADGGPNADGHLYHVRVSTRDAVAKFRARAFSVAADGRRIAYISGGRLNIATLDNTFALVRPSQIPTILSNLNGVAFTGEGWLAVSGTYENQTRVVEITLDGAMVGNRQHALTDPGWLPGEVATPVVTSLTASLDDPLGVGPSRRIFLTANDLARDSDSGFKSLADEIIGTPAGKNPINAFFL